MFVNHTDPAFFFFAQMNVTPEFSRMNSHPKLLLEEKPVPMNKMMRTLITVVNGWIMHRDRLHI